MSPPRTRPASPPRRDRPSLDVPVHRRSRQGPRPSQERRQVTVVTAVGLVSIFAAMSLAVWRAPPGPTPLAAAKLGGPAPASVVGGCDAALAVSLWPLRARLGQVLFVQVDASDPMAAARAADAGAGGVFVGGNRTELLASGTLAGLANRRLAPFVAVDDEGGRVQRIDALAGDIPSARTMAETMTPAQVRTLALRRGHQLRELGVTMDFAPVVDVSAQPDQAVIGDRSFSSQPATVVAYARAFTQGLLDADVRPVLKHFPGHGRATGDSHLGPAVTPPLEELSKVDLVPYRSLLDRPGVAVLVSALDVPGLTEGGPPASLNPVAVDGLLRRRLGFDGLVITDDLGRMRAVTSRYSTIEAITLALGAGSDMALIGGRPDVDRLVDRLAAEVAAGRIATSTLDRAVARILAAKGVSPC